MLKQWLITLLLSLGLFNNQVPAIQDALLGGETAPVRGATTFLGLTDTPNSYSGNAGSLLQVNATSSAVTFLATSTLLSGYVPYTGATTNVDLGLHNLTVDTNSLFVDSVNHRVGIGTTSPTQIFQVVDTAIIATRGILSTQVSNTANGANFIAEKYRGTPSAKTVIQNDDYLGSLIFKGFNGVASNPSAAIMAQAGTIGIDSIPSSLMFLTSTNAVPSVMTPRMIINSSGNVGIGTTAPTANLQVAQPTAGVGTVTITGNTTCTGTGTQFLNTFKVGDNIIITATGETRAITVITSNTVMTIASSTNTVGSAYTLAGGTRFSVLGNGRVGIGTTAPTQALEVNGTIQAGQGRFSASAGASIVSIAQYNSAASIFEIYAGVGASIYDRFLVEHNGNVSLGLPRNTATSLLQVAQNTTGAGTVSVGAGGTTWTGVGTQFLNTFKVGDTITSEGQTLTILTIPSNTSLTTAAVGAAISAKTYTLTGGTRFSVLGNGNVGIGTNAPSNILSLGGTAARTIWMERNTTAATAGNNLTLQAGGAIAETADLNGGMLTLAPGLSTGTGKASVRLQRLTRTTTSTSDNSLVDATMIPSRFLLANTSANGLFTVALPTLTSAGGTINFTIYVSDGTDIQKYTGSVNFSAINKAGTYTTSISEANAVAVTSSGTLSTAWTITTGTNIITVNVTPTSSLTPTIHHIDYAVTNFGGNSNALTQL